MLEATVSGLRDLPAAMRSFPRRMLALGAGATQWRAVKVSDKVQRVWNQHLQGIGGF